MQYSIQRKRSTTKLAIVMFIALVGTIGAENVVYAQTPTNVVNLTASEMVSTVIVAALGGLLHAYQGFRTSKDNFDILRFIDGIIMCVLASIPLGVGAAITATAGGHVLTLFDYVMIFFASIGLGFQIQQARQKTVPNNTPIPASSTATDPAH